jgi:hypothetical protein
MDLEELDCDEFKEDQMAGSDVLCLVSMLAVLKHHIPKLRNT